MLATLFFMQPVGQFLATAVAIVVTYLYRDQMQDLSHCRSPTCYKAVDQAWRWIAGLGGVPALVAFVIRLQIPESPRFTMDVLLDSRKALADTQDYFEVADEILPTTEKGDEDVKGQGQGLAPHDLGIGTGLIDHHLHPRDPTNRPLSPPSPALTLTPNRSPHMSGQIRDRKFSAHSTPRATILFDGGPLPPPKSPQQAREPSKRLQLRDWMRGFHRHFIVQGNWTYLFGVCASWFILDISFYGLGLSSPSIIQELLYGKGNVNFADTHSVYGMLWGNSWHPSIIVSLAALLGGACMIVAVSRGIRLTVLQAVFFIVLGILLEVVGGTFRPLISDDDGKRHWGLVVLYFLCQFFFNFGPNSTTYMVSLCLLHPLHNLPLPS